MMQIAPFDDTGKPPEVAVVNVDLDSPEAGRPASVSLIRAVHPL
jgi:hypothetical protein